MSAASSFPLAAVAEDRELPTLSAALDPSTAGPALATRLSASLGVASPPSLQAIRLLAYKPRRRCLIEYELAIRLADGTSETVSVLGKLRAHRFGNSGYRQLRAIWEAGFASDSPDRVSVPEPLGTVPALRLWIQRKVRGWPATSVLRTREAVAFGARIAEAIQKLHTAGPPAERRHTIDDELSILARCLGAVGDAHRELVPHTHRLLDACVRLAQTLPPAALCGSHRDFYADQVLVDGERLFLVDFDLYCEADPGLDLGNFVAHVTEQSLREFGHPDALQGVERAIEDRFAALSGEASRRALRVYAALTLARHVYLSTRVAGRGHLVAALLGLATERVHLLLAEGGHA